MDKLMRVNSVWDKENTADDLNADVKMINDNEDDYS